MARKRTLPQRSGFLNIDKSPGWTSHDVVARVRRITGERQVGHAGTLDPAASGVLPVAVGHATRMLPYIEDAEKTYIATVRFGVSTDSADRDGRIVAQHETTFLTHRAIEQCLPAFRGDLTQVPPMHSAIKVDGQKLYDLARRGASVDVPARQVTVHEIDLIAWQSPEATIRIRCSKGTYIRSLARDMGDELQCGAILSHLVRVRAGQFHLASSIPVQDLEERIVRYGWGWVAMHPDALLSAAPVLILTPEEDGRWFNGLPIHRKTDQDVIRVYDSQREWSGIGVAERDGSAVAPKRVIRGSVQ